MSNASETIVFFGSGPVAADSLRLLLKDFTVEAVVTKPRPPHHRGDVPVLELAAEHNLPIYTASNAQELTELFTGRPFLSRVAILIDFGIIVSQAVIDYFPLGIINSHFSLLPEWRGADPITFSVLSGQRRTGVSLMLLVARMDEGPLLDQTAIDIAPDDTTPSLTQRLITVSYQSLVRTVPKYVHGQLAPHPQQTASIADDPQPSYSRRLTKDDGQLDWSKPAEVLERQIRAFYGWPKSRTSVSGMELIITKAHVASGTQRPGTPLVVDKLPAFGCGQNLLVIERLKPAGKQEMTGQAFLAGYGRLFRPSVENR